MNCHKYCILRNQATAEQIQRHLEACDNSFTPKLSSYVNISEYATKLFNKSETFEIWSLENLIAFLAYYVVADKNTIFVSNISIVPEKSSQGLGKHLIHMLLEHMKSENYSTIELETFLTNEIAIRFYDTLGFHRVSQTNSKVVLRKQIHIR